MFGLFKNKVPVSFSNNNGSKFLPPPTRNIVKKENKNKNEKKEENLKFKSTVIDITSMSFTVEGLEYQGQVLNHPYQAIYICKNKGKIKIDKFKLTDKECYLSLIGDKLIERKLEFEKKLPLHDKQSYESYIQDFKDGKEQWPEDVLELDRYEDEDPTSSLMSLMIFLQQPVVIIDSTGKIENLSSMEAEQEQLKNGAPIFIYQGSRDDGKYYSFFSLKDANNENSQKTAWDIYTKLAREQDKDIERGITWLTNPNKIISVPSVFDKDLKLTSGPQGYGVMVFGRKVMHNNNLLDRGNPNPHHAFVLLEMLSDEGGGEKNDNGGVVFYRYDLVEDHGCQVLWDYNSTLFDNIHKVITGKSQEVGAAQNILCKKLGVDVSHFRFVIDNDRLLYSLENYAYLIAYDSKGTAVCTLINDSQNKSGLYGKLDSIMQNAVKFYLNGDHKNHQTQKSAVDKIILQHLGHPDPTEVAKKGRARIETHYSSGKVIPYDDARQYLEKHILGGDVMIGKCWRTPVWTIKNMQSRIFDHSKIVLKYRLYGENSILYGSRIKKSTIGGSQGFSKPLSYDKSKFPTELNCLNFVLYHINTADGECRINDGMMRYLGATSISYLNKLKDAGNLVEIGNPEIANDKENKQNFYLDGERLWDLKVAGLSEDTQTVNCNVPKNSQSLPYHVVNRYSFEYDNGDNDLELEKIILQQEENEDEVVNDSTVIKNK
jgi:hypothetical protein